MKLKNLVVMLMIGMMYLSACNPIPPTPVPKEDSLTSAFAFGDTLCTLVPDTMVLDTQKQLRIAQNFTSKSDTGVIYGVGAGLNGNEILKADITYAPMSTTLHRLQVDVHGGGGKGGSRHSTGTVPMNKGNTTKYGDVYAYIDYPLGIPNSTDSATLTKNTGEEMYRTIQSIYAFCRFMAKPENVAKYHVDVNNIWISGVSWGAGAAFLALHWQPSEYNLIYVRDTTKWFNNSNAGYKFKIAGVIGISGFVFQETDIDKTTIPMVVVHGGKDVLIICDGGTSKKVAFEGGCSINTLSELIHNPINFLLIANAEHSMKVTGDPFASAMNLLQTRNFINQSITNYH